MQVFVQQTAGAELVEEARELAQASESIALTVLAASPRWADADVGMTDITWPRVPGAFVIGQDASEKRLLATEFLPCGECDACRAGAPFRCRKPVRPGVTHDGGFADAIVLSAAAPLCPQLPEALDPVLAVALLALGGPCYQAVCTVGMVPGDTVIVRGNLGPGLLPLQLLRAVGLRGILFDPAGHATELAAELDLVAYGELPQVVELPSPRCHLLDFGGEHAPTERSWGDLLTVATSWTCVGTRRVALSAVELIDQLPVRYVSALHPELALDVLALLTGERLQVAPWVARCDRRQLPTHFAQLTTAGPHLQQWPVYEAR